MPQHFQCSGDTTASVRKVCILLRLLQDLKEEARTYRSFQEPEKRKILHLQRLLEVPVPKPASFLQLPQPLSPGRRAFMWIPLLHSQACISVVPGHGDFLCKCGSGSPLGSSLHVTFHKHSQSPHNSKPVTMSKQNKNKTKYKN